jgi:hypothetical protein
MNKILENFSPEAQKIFVDNNITGNIAMPAKEIELVLINEGYEVLDIARIFFELCGYFSISFVWDRENDIYCKLIIDPTKYADSDDRIDIDNAFGKNLCPLAYLSWGGLVMMDSQECVYLFEDGQLDLLGNSLTTGVEEIFKGEKWRLNS